MEIYIPIKEAAEKMGIDQSSLRKLLKNYPDIKQKYVRKIRTTGGLKFHISKNGLVLLYSMKSKGRSNRYKKVVTTHLEKPKQDLIEKAIDQSMLTPAQALLKSVQIIVQMEQRVDGLEKTVESLMESNNKRLLAADRLMELPEPDIKLNDFSDKAMVHQRVGAYSISSGETYSNIYNKLYEEFNYRYRKNVRLRARNENTTILVAIDNLGMMKELWDISCAMLKIKD